MEENRNFSWTNLFVKVILAIIFVLFAVWLLSLSNKGVSNSLDVLTDNIFAENIDRMKEVGKEYFTIERLPQRIGEIETLTLEEMYEKKLILEIKDKNGNACDAEDSYVSIEKLENEYQMKVNLECDDREEYIIVIMGCYDYCDTDICEVKEDEVVSNKELEYEYKKTTGGKWSDYGSWSEWSKISVTATDYRQVETKKEKEEYTYSKVVTDNEYASFEVGCPEGYKLNSDKTKCYKTTPSNSYEEPTCPSVSGYTLTGRDGFTCKYSKTTTKTSSLKSCPTVSGYTYTGRNGLTCNYKKTYKVAVGKQLVSTCSGCAAQWQTIYETRTTTTTRTTSCQSGYSYNSNSDNCVKNETVSITKNASCPAGYNESNNSCVKITYNTNYKDIIKSCPAGYKETSNNTRCYKTVSHTVTETGTREVTYYRYRIREYINGTVDYKWSKSKNDKKLLDAGYKLTGRTR